MDSFDKKINELYNQPEQDVPSDLSWDHMQDGIYSRMDNKKSRRKVIWFWIGGSLISAALIIGSVILLNSEAQNTNTPTIDVALNSNKKSLQTPPTAGKSLISENNTSQITEKNKAYRSAEVEAAKSTPVKTNITKSTTNPNYIQSIEDAKRRSITDTKTVNSNSNKSQINPNTSVTNNIAINNIKKTNSENQNPLLNARNDLEKSSTTNSTPVISREILYLSYISKIESTQLKNQRKKIASSLQKINIDDTPSEVETKRSTKYAFSLLGGTSLHNGYNIQSNEHTTSLPGYSMRLGLSAEKESGWGYDIGIGHTLLVEKFDLDMTDTVSIYQQDIITGKLTNTVSGITTNIIGEGYSSISRYRRELSYNTINLLSIDAAIFRRINLSERWSLAPSIGLQYNRVIGIEGKSLDTLGEVFPYDNGTSDINKNLISARLGLSVDYVLTHRLSLSARANTGISFNNLYTDGSKLSTTNIQGGITIRL